VTILNKIKEYKLEEIKNAKRISPLSTLEGLVKSHSACRGFGDALKSKKADNHIGLIAEIKKASPSKGLIRADFDVVNLAKAYQNGGATCLSILTDTPSFQGHDDFLNLGRNAVDLPVIRKDFMFDPYQILQSRALGADCILLIMACLEIPQAIELEQSALELGMDILIETHNETEMDNALTHLKSDLIGINNRDLHTFVTDLSVSERLSKMVTPSKLCISESGIANKTDIERLQKSLINSFLIGESLMRHQDVCLATKTLLGV